MFTFNDTASKDCKIGKGQQAWDFAQANKATAKCVGYIDVNGIKGPNKENTATRVEDIYPVVFFNQTIAPATEAGQAILFGK